MGKKYAYSARETIKNLFVWTAIKVKQMLNKFPEQRPEVLVSNLKHNWFFPVSACAYFCANANMSIGYFLGIPIVIGVFIVVATQIKSMWLYAKECNTVIRIFSALSAVGVCWGTHTAFCIRWDSSPRAQNIEAMLPFSFNISSITIPLAVLSGIFVVFCVLFFCKKFAGIISENRLFYGITKQEIIIYSVLLVLSLALVVGSFSQTEAFYGTQYPFDIIYTSDSPTLVQRNAYLALTNAENDLRQPLFAVFSAPFIGIPYLIGRLCNASDSAQAILINSVQILMLYSANFLLAKTMKLSPYKRVCFMLISSFTYTQLLFTLMMEQYIIAYFWLVLCVYLLSEGKPNKIAFFGAGGTLLTGMALLPYMSRHSPTKAFKLWVVDMVKCCLGFIGVILTFCRFDVVFDMGVKTSQLSTYGGENVAITDRLFQYTNFLSDYFTAPNAGVNPTACEFISWKLNTANGINVIGVGIFLLAALSAILNREKKSSLLAMSWVAFSAAMLFGLGWGTKENGLILYALYFGWAFLVLAFQLVEWVEDKLNTKILLPIVSIVSVVLLAVINIPAIIELINFAITYYPT